MNLNANVSLIPVGVSVGQQARSEGKLAISRSVDVDRSYILENKKFDMIFAHKSNGDELMSKAQVAREVTQSRSTFTLFKMSNGVLYTRVRNLDTGEIKYYPSLDETDFNKIVEQSQHGLIFDLKG